MSSIFENSTNRVIVTGATGFVGQHLVPILLQNSYEVIATGRNTEKAKNFSWFNDVQFVSFDFHKDEKKIKVRQGDGLIHLAWEGLANFKAPFHFEENLPHNYRFVKSLVSEGVQHVLITGTCLEYGFQNGLIASTAKPQPNNPYAVAKNSLRQYLEFLAKEKPFIFQWARLFYMYGKGQNPKSVLAELDTAIENNANQFNMSGGEQLRDYLSIENVAQQLFDLYSTKGAGTYNVCSGEAISIRRLLEQRIAERNSNIKLNLGYYPYTDYEPMAFWGVRDIGQTIYLPALPNAALKSKKNAQSLAPVRLRYNETLRFLENEAFDPYVIDYSQNYENSQAHSQRFLVHMTDVLQRLKEEMVKGSLIVEVGCGKGAFVELLQNDGYFTVKGFDASYEGYNHAIEKRYLSVDDKISADIIVLRHVLEHIQQPHNFLAMLRSVFGSAKIYIEVPNYDWIVDHQAYFDITYEHVNYFSQAALKSLFQNGRTKQGLLFDDQYHYVISDLSSLNSEFEFIYNSKTWKYVTFDSLFPKMVQRIESIQSLVKNKSLFVWGAATKGCLFLAHCAAKKKLIDKVLFAIDINPKKLGKFLPGSLVEIKSKKDFYNAAKDGDVLLVANPAYKDEIKVEVEKENISHVIIETL